MEKNKKLIGKFKDESPDEGIESFVGIRSKNAIHSKLKILQSRKQKVLAVVVKKNISFGDYKKCVLNDIPKNVKINAIRTFKNDKLFSYPRKTRVIKQI